MRLRQCVEVLHEHVRLLQCSSRTCRMCATVCACTPRAMHGALTTKWRHVHSLWMIVCCASMADCRQMFLPSTRYQPTSQLCCLVLTQLSHCGFTRFCVLGQITEIDRVQEVPNAGAFADLLWADPEEALDTWAISARGVGYYFGHKVAAEVRHCLVAAWYCTVQGRRRVVPAVSSSAVLSSELCQADRAVTPAGHGRLQVPLPG